MTHPIKELTVALFIYFYLFNYFLFIFYYCYYYFLFIMSVFVDDTDLNQCFGLFSSIYVQQSWFIIKDTKISFLSIT